MYRALSPGYLLVVTSKDCTISTHRGEMTSALSGISLPFAPNLPVPHRQDKLCALSILVPAYSFQRLRTLFDSLATCSSNMAGSNDSPRRATGSLTCPYDVSRTKPHQHYRLFLYLYSSLPTHRVKECYNPPVLTKELLFPRKSGRPSSSMDSSRQTASR